MYSDYYFGGVSLNTQLKTRDLVVSALLIAIGILIPMIFTGLPFRIVVGPYSATLMAHVPIIIAMFISPWTAVFTAVGTTIGFFFTAPFVVAVRAASHIVFAIVGAYMLKRGSNLIVTGISTGIIHAVFEGIVVLIFFATGASTSDTYSSVAMMWITMGGTLAHHVVDFAIAVAVGSALARAHMIPKLPPMWGSKKIV